jgi:AcrR family transcriptional regulator
MRTRDENKERIIRQKAIEMFVAEGFDGLSMQKLAKAADVSPATIYIYFRDREDLILQIYIEESRKVSKATLENFDPEMHFDEGLRVQWINRAKYCIQNPLGMQFIEQVRHSPLFEKAFSMMDKVFIDSMKVFVTTAIERKELIPLPLQVYWAIAFAPMYQLVKFEIEGGFGQPGFKMTEQIMDQTLSLVLKALKP